jgi:hypothetical protein
LVKVQNINGVPVVRNKIVNAITFILKAFGSNDEQTIKAFFPNNQLKKKQSTLILIGALRLLLKSNKGLMKFILKGLVSKDESSVKGF